jgi:uncharacterized protein YaiE (UPF0345 family)
MTREEFIEQLDQDKIAYNLSGDVIEITGSNVLAYKWNVTIQHVKALPSGVIFSNKGYVFIKELGDIPEGVQFNNGGNITLGLSDRGIKIHPSVQFNNGKSKIMLGYQGGGKYMFNTSGDWGQSWVGSIDDVSTKRLFKLMVKQRVFL